ncbi:hypothetical protein S83_054907, partial [Arachis hypogaea]
SASPHSPSPQPLAARRHPLRLTASLNSEGTNSTKGVGTGQIQTRHPRTCRCRELAVAAQSNLPFQRRRPRPVAVAFPVKLAIASPFCSVTLSNRMSFANTPSETPSSQEQGSTTDASIGTQKNNNRAKNDPAWDHCKQVVESGKTILLCIYCEKLIRGGGIHRFKLHLAGKGGDVESCRK